MRHFDGADDDAPVRRADAGHRDEVVDAVAVVDDAAVAVAVAVAVAAESDDADADVTGRPSVLPPPSSAEASVYSTQPRLRQHAGAVVDAFVVVAVVD